MPTLTAGMVEGAAFAVTVITSSGPPNWSESVQRWTDVKLGTLREVVYSITLHRSAKLDTWMPARTKQRTAAENRLVAVSHPLRASILQILTVRAATPGEMARELDDDLSLVSHHTKRLVKLGCAELAYERKTPSSVEHVYRATERHLIETGDWDDVIAQSPELAEFLVGEYMQAIVDDFVAAGSAGVGQDEEFHITRTPISLDEQGMVEALEIFQRAREDIEGVHDRALARGDADIRASSSLAFFRLAPPKR